MKIYVVEIEGEYGNVQMGYTPSIEKAKEVKENIEKFGQDKAYIIEYETAEDDWCDFD